MKVQLPTPKRAYFARTEHPSPGQDGDSPRKLSGQGSPSLQVRKASARTALTERGYSGAIRLRPSYGATREGPYTFLRNEPTVLADEILCIMRVLNYLCRLQKVFAGGFVFQNEPTGRGF